MAGDLELMEEYVNIDEDIDTLIPERRREIRIAIANDTLQAVNDMWGDIQPVQSFYSKYGKRILDIIASVAALIITLPINGVLAICTFFDVGSPIIFKQQRVGKDEKLFTIIKFRNMNNKRDANGNLLLGRDRVTRFGRFVRRTSLDELLNFVSILKGDMSVIGPRPLPDAYTDFMADKHRKRYCVRPGLECPFLHELDHKITWGEQFDNDVWYVQNISFKTDLKMIAALVSAVFNKKSSKMRGSSLRGSFMGYYADGRSINSQAVPAKYVRMHINGNNIN